MQDQATECLWTYNNDRLNVVIGGMLITKEGYAMKTNISYSITRNPYKLTVYIDDKAIQSFIIPSELGSTLSALALTGLKLLLRNSYAGNASEASKLLAEKIEKIKASGEFIKIDDNPISDPILINIDNMLATLDPETDAEVIDLLNNKRKAHLMLIAGGAADSEHTFKLGD